VVACEIKSKCGVSPFITQPRAINASYFFIFLEIMTGISKTPGTFMISCFDRIGTKLSSFSLFICDVIKVAVAPTSRLFDIS